MNYLFWFLISLCVLIITIVIAHAIVVAEKKNAGYKDVNNYQEMFSDEKMINNAVKNALDIRKFEIGLYWKRASYFWAFILLAFTAYFTISDSIFTNVNEIRLIVSSIGLIFSISWYYVNRGSKYWQNNWEQHVDNLEDNYMGPIYRIILKRDEFKFTHLLGPYPFSVSRINQVINLYIIFIWIYLLVNSLSNIFKLYEPVEHFNVLVILMALIISVILLSTFGQSGKGESTKKMQMRELITYTKAKEES